MGDKRVGLVKELFGPDSSWPLLSTEQRLAYQREWRRRDKKVNPQSYRDQSKRVREKRALDPVRLKKYLDYQRKYANEKRAKFTDYYKTYRLKAYGLTQADYHRMLDAQGWKCVLCSVSFEDKRKICIDHCHNSKKVRGLLCHNCNLFLGNAQDDPDLMRRGAEYVERHREA